MSNMSYCRFENTARDLADCRGALESLFEGEESLSGAELMHAKYLVRTCADILARVAEARYLDLDSEGAFSECEAAIDATLNAAAAQDVEA